MAQKGVGDEAENALLLDYRSHFLGEPKTGRYQVRWKMLELERFATARGKLISKDSNTERCSVRAGASGVFCSDEVEADC